jgi:predicted transcriptional regulator
MISENLMLRIRPDLKLRLKIYAMQHGKSASAIAAEAIEDYLAFREQPEPTPPVVLNGKKKGGAA